MSRIDHVVVLMLENRSFDHMLGLMPGVNGLKQSFSNELKGKKFTTGPGAPFAIDRADIDPKGFGGPGHSFPDANEQLYGDRNGPSAGQLAKPAPLSGFVTNYASQLAKDVHRTNPSDDEIRVPMAVFEQGRLPVIERLAQEFCVCDQWFSEMPGPTQPNRLFVHAATATGFAHNVWKHPIQVRTIYEELDAVSRDWAFFYFDLRDSDSFPQIKKRIDRVLKFSVFYDQAKAGKLPAYSFLCPRYADSTDGFASSQHAPYDVRYGEHLIADVYEALRNGPGWNKTLLVVTYDEHGGFFDHVSPPTAGVSSPDGLSSPTEFDHAEAQKDPAKSDYLLQPDYQFDFKRLGLRVPAILISPLITKGRVDSTRYQHTSILATLRDLFGVKPLTARDKEAKSFTAVLSLATPRTDAPTKLERPPLPPAKTADVLGKPPTPVHAEMWPILANLDGHPDSGKEPPLPKTRGDAAKYIQERIAAHEAFHRAAAASPGRPKAT